MSRTLSATVQAAVTQVTTAPVYLVRFGFAADTRAASWSSDITWDGYTWIASGLEVSALSATGCRIKLPTGSSDPWLALVLNEGVRSKSVDIYEHHTDTSSSPQADAVLLFSGIMDSLTIGDEISIKVIESSQAKVFPPSVLDESTFTHLLKPGDKLAWGQDTLVVT